jgi:hypothetical protein
MVTQLNLSTNNSFSRLFAPSIAGRNMKRTRAQDCHNNYFLAVVAAAVSSALVLRFFWIQRKVGLAVSDYRRDPPLGLFPWEPAQQYVDRATDSSSTAESKGGSARPNIVVYQQQRTNSDVQLNSTENKQQLEFLASMTFANGGMRPPSCPCCL